MCWRPAPKAGLMVLLQLWTNSMSTGLSPALIRSSPVVASSLWRRQRAAPFRRSISGESFVEVGGLISYGPSLSTAYRELGIYAGRILKGAMPADLPVQQSVKVEM